MKLDITRSAQKDLDKIPDKEALKISHKIYQIAENPHLIGNQKLSGEEGYRLRVGDYRIIYLINEKLGVVTVIKVRHRKEVYKK